MTSSKTAHVNKRKYVFSGAQLCNGISVVDYDLYMCYLVQINSEWLDQDLVVRIQNKSPQNFGEAGYRLELRCRGEYQSFLTLVESIPISKNEESGSSYLGSSRVSS